jgi:hypothetical protein
VTCLACKMIYGGQRRYGEEHGTGHAEEVVIMAAEKEGGRPIRRKGSAGRGGSARVGRTVEEAGLDNTVVDVDPWGSFFERFWGPAEGESADRPPDRGQQQVKGTRKTGAKRGR